jgi:hypothetical protein
VSQLGTQQNEIGRRPKVQVRCPRRRRISSVLSSQALELLMVIVKLMPLEVAIHPVLGLLHGEKVGSLSLSLMAL